MFFVNLSFEYKVFDIDLSLPLFEFPKCPLCLSSLMHVDHLLFILCDQKSLV
jgi:hypothetical protein